MALAYNVRAKNEVNLLIQRAVAAGATILNPPGDTPWGGYSGYFAEPHGFAWEVAWNPAWRLAPDGSVPDDLFRNLGDTIVGRVRQ